MYRCFVCGASGGTIDLVMNYLNKDFKEACRWLADEHNIIMDDGKLIMDNDASKPAHALGDFSAARYERFFERPWLSPEARKFLFEERRIDPRVVRWCRLTSWRDKQGTPWLQIPYFSQEGRLVGIQNRNLNYHRPDSEGQSSIFNLPSSISNSAPRFRFPSGSRCGIYNLPVLNLLQPHDELYITEGSSDCWAMLSAGHKAIAIPSATLLSKKDIDQLSILHSQLSIHYHMYPDRDEPGERLFLQLQQVLPNLEHHQLPQGCKDFGEYYLSTKLSKVIPE